jgi:hypothetical protein
MEEERVISRTSETQTTKKQKEKEERRAHCKGQNGISMTPVCTGQTYNAPHVASSR